jgi:hypothetical protein
VYGIYQIEYGGIYQIEYGGIYQFELSADVDPLRRDAEDARLLEPVLRVVRAHGHGRGQRGRHHDRDDVQAAKNCLQSYFIILTFGLLNLGQ